MYRTKKGQRLVIRNVMVKDMNQVLKFWQSIADEKRFIATEKVDKEWAQRWVKSVSERGSLHAAAVLDGEIVGMLTLGKYGNLKKAEHVRVLGMGVAKPFRGIGVGNALVDFAIRWAAGHRVRRIALSVFSPNRRAIRLYEKFGFSHEGVRNKQFLIEGRYVDEIEMGLLLGPLRK